MQFSASLNQQLDELHLLKHPFYQAWNKSTLSMETLKTYAGEYYHHAAKGAQQGAKLLWSFLDGVMEECMPIHAAC